MIGINRLAFVLLFAVIIAATLLLFQQTTTDAEYSRYNVEWNGTSGFFSQVEAHHAAIMEDCTAIRNERDTILLIIAPNRPFDPAEIESLKDYLAGGNTIFIADESFAGNELLAALGSSIRIGARNLSSIDREYQDPALILARSSAEYPLLEDVDTLLLNRPAALTGGETLAASTLLSWIDEDGDRQIGKGEAMGRHAVLAREMIGGGEVIVLADGSLFINGMTELAASRDNTRFIANLLALRPHLAVEQAHTATGSSGLVIDVREGIQKTNIFKLLILTVLIGLSAVAQRMSRGGFHGREGD
ncbi:MAG: Uncharacterized protein XE10_0044 [Methanoculleus marisnigri]|uniref:DUF4350 domain-containing protein n=1 Tax=Methanoculleus marisnigri TaxID=2198 RepID=A0A101GTJ1_9EURY|nr:DUF4350 domain-containing protein [Methanoculleus marisnigri]KUK63945.1 MAG: Uncharacterized protein XD82_0017 [Methanoculleus marisnigri]KUL05684.1 MAG: Uncharacterized protein XE10_0044 [Methanoculleus marisnigri]